VILSLTLPIPPSANNMFYNVPGKGRRKSKDYRAWIAAAMGCLWEQKPRGGFPTFERGFHILVAVPVTMRGDAGNREKAASDFLKKPAGIISDDRHAASVAVHRVSSVPAGMCIVTVSDKPISVAEAA
jgi:Holliday junction resolvase RusA-like endonuclease